MASSGIDHREPGMINWLLVTSGWQLAGMNPFSRATRLNNDGDVSGGVIVSDSLLGTIRMEMEHAISRVGHPRFTLRKIAHRENHVS
jgi:hypothetical protein